MMNNDLTPQGISTASFADKAKEYEDISKSINNSEEAVSNAEFELKQWLNIAGFGQYAEGDKITDLWDKIQIMKPAEIDKTKTQELRVAYAERLKKVVSAKIALQKQRSKLTDVKNYIVFLKEIAQLAMKGKDQQKGGQ